ncbi:hypothetical protein ACP70R_009222 [Stipagrostis hirtigluma subsp. patula]
MSPTRYRTRIVAAPFAPSSSQPASSSLSLSSPRSTPICRRRHSTFPGCSTPTPKPRAAQRRRAGPRRPRPMPRHCPLLPTRNRLCLLRSTMGEAGCRGNTTAPARERLALLLPHKAAVAVPSLLLETSAATSGAITTAGTSRHRRYSEATKMLTRTSGSRRTRSKCSS